MKYREEIDVIISILNAAEKDVLQDRIIQKCNLTTKRCDEYVQMLLQKGLLDAFPLINLRHMSGRSSKRRMTYRTSKGGQKFLRLYSELYALVDKGA